MKHNIAGQVKRIIAEQLGIHHSDVKDEHTLHALGADSLDEIETLMAIEEHFQLDIDDDEARNAKTVKQAIDYIELRLNRYWYLRDGIKTWADNDQPVEAKEPEYTPDTLPSKSEH